MAKSLTLANGSMLVGLDAHGQVRDLYYPYVGLENHVSSAGGTFVHRVGVWVEGRFAWLSDPSWNVEVTSEEGTMSGTVKAVNDELCITLTLSDCVAHDENIFIREALLENRSLETRTVKLFFAQQFRIAEDRSGSTGFYDPRVPAVIHYKGRVNFLVNGHADGAGFTDYSVGLFNMESRDGTYIDAEDGMLSKNPIEHGSVDSVIGFEFMMPPHTRKEVAYWILAGETIREVHALDANIQKKGHHSYVRATKTYWNAWLRRSKSREKETLHPELLRLYEESLLVVRAHMDKRGGIIASSDSDILNYGRDTYSYVWPRDSAFAARSLDSAGYPDLARSFFEFIGPLLESQGYLMHKYRSDGALGSSWHPWIWNGKPALPIQEDETATILFTLAQHFTTARDADFIEALYPKLIAPMGYFLLRHIDHATNLPMESYDLWEENFGTSTYTSASVFGGLTAAAELAHRIGKTRDEGYFRAAAEKMRQAIGTRLFNKQKGRFLKYIRRTEEGFEESDVLDISGLHGLLHFNVFPVDDPRITAMYASVERELKVPGDVGGYMRYAEDRYYRISDQDSPNPWIVTTLWIARYHIKKARKLEDLEPALELLWWTRKRALSTYLLPEQMHPHTGVPLSATPLVWSHAEYILTVHAYLERERMLKHF